VERNDPNLIDLVILPIKTFGTAEVENWLLSWVSSLLCTSFRLRTDPLSLMSNSILRLIFTIHQMITVQALLVLVLSLKMVDASGVHIFVHLCYLCFV